MLYRNRKEVPGEVIYEITTAADQEGFGYAVADIQRSEAHHHNHTLEIYTLISGQLDVHVAGSVHRLARPGDTVEIPIRKTHWAESLDATPARIVVTTIPAWRAEDHILERAAS